MSKVYNIRHSGGKHYRDQAFGIDVDLNGVSDIPMIGGNEYKEWGNVTFYTSGDYFHDYLNNVKNWLIFSPRLQELFQKMEITGIQWLPVKIYRKENNEEIKGYQVCNVTNVISALDAEHSKWIDSPDYPGERMLTIPAFKASAIEGYDIFHLQEFHPPVYVTGRLRNAIKKANLTGFAFDPRRVY